ncbi:hypothetical protein MRX96_012724 [Rhipicephalus microplus]
MFQGTLGRPLGIEALRCLQGIRGSRFRSTERARRSSTSQHRFTSRLGQVSLEPTRSRSRTPTTSNSKKLTLSWADKFLGGRESPRGNEEIAVLSSEQALRDAMSERSSGRETRSLSRK